MAKRTPEPPKPEDPRQRIRVYKDGLHLLGEWYLDPNQKKIDLDLYITIPPPDITIHGNYLAEKVDK